MAISYLVSIVLRQDGICAVGFVALQLLFLIYRAGYSFVTSCSTKVDHSKYKHANLAFVAQLADTNMNRSTILHPPSVYYMYLIEVVHGVCEALVVILPHSVGDIYICLIVLCLINTKRYFQVLAVCLAIAASMLLSFPCASNLLRGTLLTIGLISSQVNRNAVKYIQVLVSCSIVALHAGGVCSNKLKSLSPISLLSNALLLHMNPSLILLAVILPWLVG